jgi:hypothetical protein
VNKNIETTEGLHHLLHALATSFRICDVGFHESRRHSMSPNCSEKTVRHRNLLSRHNGNVSALACQRESGGSPDTTGTPGD